MNIQINQPFGRWIVLGYAGTKPIGKQRHPFRYWSCRCTCGTIRDVMEDSLLAGSSISCGCYNRERSREANWKHGRTSEFMAWSNMIGRCADPDFRGYGDRGIKVCDAWRTSFATFLADMGPKPSPEHSLNRIDNNGDYTPGNCKWSTAHEQMTNRRNTVYVDDIPLATLAKQHNISGAVLRHRLLAGWPLEEALNKPVRYKRPNAT